VSFGLSYRNLPEGRQRLFRLLGLHPGSDIDAYTAAALDGAGLATVRRILDELFGYHLIEEPARGRYRFHDLIRQYARTLCAADPVAERDAAIDRLLDFYLHTARAADRHLARRTSAMVAALTPNPPAHAPDIPTREDALTWMDAERPNLQAAADYAALHERTGHATAIPDAVHSFLRGQGYWDQALTLHRTALNAACHASDRSAEAGALTDMGAVQHLTGDYQAARAGLTRALRLYRDCGDQLGEANALNELGAVQYLTGSYRKAIASLTGALELYRDCGDRLGEASALNNLGIGQQLTGDNRAAAASLTQSLEIYRDLGNRNGEANALNNLGIGQERAGDYRAATASSPRRCICTATSATGSEKQRSSTILVACSS
jgi:tetratricopeptide (TPR) repeat protein